MRDWIAWESAKRLRNWDRAERWRVLQQTITWAERQATVQRNTPAACLREQQRKLSQMPTHQAGQPIEPEARIWTTSWSSPTPVKDVGRPRRP